MISKHEVHSVRQPQGLAIQEIKRKANYLSNNETLIEWLKECLLANKVMCQNCGEKMKCVPCKDRSDGLKFECRGKGTKRHRMERSIR